MEKELASASRGHLRRCGEMLSWSPMLRLHFALESKVRQGELEREGSCPRCAQEVRTKLKVENKAKNRCKAAVAECSTCCYGLRRTKLKKKKRIDNKCADIESAKDRMVKDERKRKLDNGSVRQQAVSSSVDPPAKKKKKRSKKDENAGLTIPAQLLQKRQQQQQGVPKPKKGLLAGGDKLRAMLGRDSSKENGARNDNLEKFLSAE